MHLKRQDTPKKWPIPRKGSKYVIKPSSNTKEGVPILIFLRDMLKLANNRKEVKKAINKREILLNGKEIKNENLSVLLLDRVSVVPSKKNYELTLSENGKLQIKEVKSGEEDKKISKIENKKILRGKKTQLNLKDGRNFISEIDCKVNDSVIINFKNKKIEKCLPLKEKSKAMVFAGKHSGKVGSISRINHKEKTVELETKHGKFNILIKQMMVIE
jgi:small subunit ribosomal protein S4e